MHKSAALYGKEFFDSYCQKDSSEQIVIIEIGSQDVNGSLRESAPDNATYIGLDFVNGKGVDLVIDDPYKIAILDNFADVVVTSSCFEHSEFFWLTFLEISRIVKPGGIIYINAPSNGMYHRWPVDCWRFYPDSGYALAKWAKKNNYPIDFVESFIGARSQENVWNDFVSIFHKKKNDEDIFLPKLFSKLDGISNIRLSITDDILMHREHTYEYNLIESLNSLIDQQKEEILRLTQAIKNSQL